MSTIQPAGRQPRARKKGLESLEVWWKARELAVLVYQQLEKLPPDERYGLASQLRRVSVSVVANIAEGHGRLGRAEYHHHVSIALGSVIELKTLLLLCTDLEFRTPDDIAPALAEAERVASMLWKLGEALKHG